MGDVIYVDFTKPREEPIEQDDKSDLQQRIDNIHGSLDRINKLVRELKGMDKDDTTTRG